MRENKREKILDAAVRVVERVGAGRLTLEAAAEEAGLTRGGMMYHFRDRDALRFAIQEHLAAQWEQSLVDAAGKNADEATAAERVAAYARVAMESATQGELELILETNHDAAMNEPWLRVQRRWTPTAEDALKDAESMRHFILRLAADGLWSFDSLAGESLPASTRRILGEEIIRFARESD